MTDENSIPEGDAVVAWLRQVSPYFQNHRGKTFVVYFSGKTVDDPSFANVIRDLVILAAVGIRLVVVFGARPQIEARLVEKGIEQRSVGGLTICDGETMAEVTEVVGAMRLRIESAFSFGSRGGPFAGALNKIASGNFVFAKPAGIIDGMDLGFTGRVRSIDKGAIESRLTHGEIVLLAPLGFSPTGELFNLEARDLAGTAASELGAEKLILVAKKNGVSAVDGSLCRALTLHEASELRDAMNSDDVEHDFLAMGINACHAGVNRVHIVGRRVDGAILRELFTRDGVGTLISSAPFDHLRWATPDDVGGIFELVQPLAVAGVLVERSRERLETEIERFVVMIRENTVVACGSIHDYSAQRVGEVACIAVHPDYRGGQFGDVLLEELERRARELEIESLFVLSTQATQWFNERGFDTATLESLPIEKRELYNYQRNSAVLVKSLI